MSIGVVKTRFGLMKGVECDGLYEGVTIFKGVPYAAPPVGELRWRPPADPESWEGIKCFDTFGPAAVQIFLKGNHGQEYYFGGVPECNEDCLYLNIATGAESPEEKRPVYIWFHGGGFTNCYAYEPQFDPREMAKRGVIVVTVGHRLSLFGYLALPQLTKEQGGRSGNYGLMDQWKAFEWIYANISAFGGDPERITVGGQSGGCTKALSMAASPLNKGRIKGVISHSGFKMKYRAQSLKQAEEQGREYLRYIGLDPDISLEELRSLDTYRLFVDAPRAIMPGELVCDAELVPFISMEEAVERFAGDVDMLSGSNFGEADVFANSKSGISRHPVRDYVREIRNSADLYAHFRNLLGELYDKYDVDEILKTSDETAKRDARYLAGLGLMGFEGMNFSRNVTLNCMFGAHRKKLGQKGRSFTYYWTHLEPFRPEDIGTAMDPEKLLAWHSSELWFTFHSLRPGIPPTRPWRPIDYEVAERMCSYWINFIKTGDPNGEGLPEWPESDSSMGWMELGDEAVSHSYEGTARQKLCMEFVSREYDYRI